MTGRLISEATEEELRNEIKDRELRELWRVRRMLLPAGYYLDQIVKHDTTLTFSFYVRKAYPADEETMKSDPYFNPAKPDQGYTAR
jgi:hypothetical protein